MLTIYKYPLKLSSGELVCPRKSGPFPAVIGAMACTAMHNFNSDACVAKSCELYKTAKKRAKYFKWDENGKSPPIKNRSNVRQDG